MKINSLATTTFIALLGLTLATACNGKGDEADDEAAGTETGAETTAGESESGDTTSAGDTTTSDTSTTASDTTTTETTDGACMGELPMGGSCTSDCECVSQNCYVVPFLGGQCGECNEDIDCPAGGCTPPNPFEANGSVCNMGELGGGCESSDVCADGLVCGNVLDLLGLIQINTCGNCEDDAGCTAPQICAPVVSVMEFSGINDCIDPNSLPQDSFCNLMGNGNDACESTICSTIDIMGLAQVGACGECNTDADCLGGTTCMAGEFILDTGTLVGSTCQ